MRSSCAPIFTFTTHTLAYISFVIQLSYLKITVILSLTIFKSVPFNFTNLIRLFEFSFKSGRLKNKEYISVVAFVLLSC